MNKILNSFQVLKFLKVREFSNTFKIRKLHILELW